jgi:hypothetical protein
MKFASIESHRSFLKYLIEEPGVRVWSQVRSLMDCDIDDGLLSEMASEGGYELYVRHNVLNCTQTADAFDRSARQSF